MSTRGNNGEGESGEYQFVRLSHQIASDFWHMLIHRPVRWTGKMHGWTF